MAVGWEMDARGACATGNRIGTAAEQARLAARRVRRPLDA
jgi:hypothetical protein